MKGTMGKLLQIRQNVLPVNKGNKEKQYPLHTYKNENYVLTFWVLIYNLKQINSPIITIKMYMCLALKISRQFNV